MGGCTLFEVRRNHYMCLAASRVAARAGRTSEWKNQTNFSLLCGVALMALGLRSAPDFARLQHREEPSYLEKPWLAPLGTYPSRGMHASKQTHGAPSPEVLKEARESFLDRCATSMVRRLRTNQSRAQPFNPKVPDLRLPRTQNSPDGEIRYINPKWRCASPGMPGWQTP